MEALRHLGNVAGHALCNSHLLRELIAVTETGTALDQAWARQAIDALLALKKAAEAAREAGRAAMDPQTRAEHEDWFRKAAAAGIALNAARKGKLQQKRHALATRMQAREDDYLRFARDLHVPFDNDVASHCTSWGCCAVFGWGRLGWLADVILACGGDICGGSRAA